MSRGDRIEKIAIPEWVIETASRHVAERPPVPGFRLVFHFQQRVARGWYFDYAFARLPDSLPGPGSGVGGAAGFVVQTEGSIRVVSFPKLRAVLEGTTDEN